MTRDEWLSQFEDELKKLRPHVGQRLATTMALQKYDPKEHPRDLARQHDKVLRREATLTLPKKKKAQGRATVTGLEAANVCSGRKWHNCRAQSGDSTDRDH